MIEEISQIVAGSEVAAGAMNQDDAHGRVGLRRGQRSGQARYIPAVSAFFFQGG